MSVNLKRSNEASFTFASKSLPPKKKKLYIMRVQSFWRQAGYRH